MSAENPDEQIEQLFAEAINKAEDAAELKDREDILDEMIEQVGPREMAKQLLASYETLEHIMIVLRTLCLDPDTMSPVERTVYDSAHARRARANARRAGSLLVNQYDQMIDGDIGDSE